MDAIKSRLEEIAQDVRDKLIQSKLAFNVDSQTLHNACHLGARDSYNSIRMGIAQGTLEGNPSTPRILMLKMKDGLHFIAEYKGYTIDPTITQYDPNAKRFVFGPDETYPLKVIEVKDVTDFILPMWNN